MESASGQLHWRLQISVPIKIIISQCWDEVHESRSAEQGDGNDWGPEGKIERSGMERGKDS